MCRFNSACDKVISSVDLNKKGHLVDALALEGDEGRDTLR